MVRRPPPPDAGEGVPDCDGGTLPLQPERTPLGLARRRPPTSTEDGWCDEHRRARARRYDQARGGSAKRGYGARWRKARAAFLKKHPVCTICKDEGRLTASTTVDHKIPHRGDRTLFWDKTNWQALCKPCHDEKTAREDGRWSLRGRQ